MNKPFVLRRDAATEKRLALREALARLDLLEAEVKSIRHLLNGIAEPEAADK